MLLYELVTVLCPNLFDYITGELELELIALMHHLKIDSFIPSKNNGIPPWIKLKYESMDKNQLAITTYEKIANKYTQQYFDDLTDIRYIDQFLNKLPQNAQILDIGSGPGQFSQYMAKKGFQVVGIDFSKEMTAIAEARVPEVKFQYMDMRHLEFEENSFNGVLSAYSLIHIPSEEIPKTLIGFFKVLKPGGYLEIIAQKGESDKVVDEPFMPSEKMFFNFFTVEQLTNYLNNAGFNIVYQEEATSQDPEAMSDKVIFTIAQKPS